MRALTMDPGDNTGMAIWGGNGGYSHNHFFKLVGGEKHLLIAQRHQILMNHFKEFLDREGSFSSLTIEGVSLWGGSAKSQASALTGSAFRLSYLVGGYMTIFMEKFPRAELDVVDVRTWKGSLPTPILENEVQKYIGERAPNEHVACAIGIGMWRNGVL